jgi:DNA invertase Pin-like site-specific DNA recombinase
MLGVFAEFETNLRCEGQLEGHRQGESRRRLKRMASYRLAQVEKLKADGLGPTEIAKRLNIGRASVYRVVAAENGAIERVFIGGHSRVGNA